MHHNTQSFDELELGSTVRLPFPLQLVQHKNVKKKCCKKYKKGKRCKRCPNR